MRLTPALMIATMAGWMGVAAAGGAEIHVTPSGRDTNPGTVQQPLKTLDAARDAVRKLLAKGSPQEPIAVVLDAGTYCLEKPFVLEPEDSGSETHPVVYRAAPSASVVVSGGRPITGWKPGRDGLWQVEIPQVRQGDWYFHELFVGGKRRQRARTPNEGYLRAEGPAVPYKHDRNATRGLKDIRTAFKFAPGDVDGQWHDLADVNVFLYHSWTNSLHWIDRVDEGQRIAHLTNASNWPLGWWEKNERYYVENVREALDAPGEWYLDRNSGLLEYWPMPGEDMSRAEVVAPVLGQLVRIEGDWEGGHTVHDVVFQGIRFQHADWLFDDKHEMLDGQSANFLPGAIQARGAERVTLDHCEVAHVGTYGVYLESGSKHNRIVHCEIHDLGAGGVRLGETMRQKTKSKDNAVAGRAVPSLTFEQNGPRDTSYNEIHNNFIHDGGHVFAAGTGVFLAHTGYNQITHNEICDFYYSGVCVGWVWGFGQSVAHHNRITDNHIHHLGWGVLSDMGGVYTLGPSPGTVVAHNYIHHVCSYSYGGWGLYTDEGSSEIVMENNLVHDTKTGGFHQHYGRDNRIRNNILAFSREAQVQRSREDLKNSVIFEHNIVYCDNDRILIRAWRNGDYKVDYNDYWTTADAVPLFDERDFDEWRATSGQDEHSVLADPRFVDPEKRDFHLRPDSPAFKVGFQPFELGGFGLVAEDGDRDWVAKPAGVVRPEFVLPPTIAPVPSTISDDFEQTAVGEPARDATTVGVAGQASIRVTDEHPAAGKHALKFTDAAGLAQTYHPYMHYKLNCPQGLLRGSFDIRRGEGFGLRWEWRDAARPYHVGPSVQITPGGDVEAGRRKLASLPADQWVHLEVVCGVGDEATGTYNLAVTIPGQPTQRFAGLACESKDFRRLQWLGFTSTGNKPATLLIDNLSLGPVK